jgi:Protein of unknown function (DUF1360)
MLLLTTPLIALLILLLGTISITRLAVSDTFPPIAKVRAAILHRFPFSGYTSKAPFRRSISQMRTNNGTYVATQDTWIGALLHCPYCIGFWISLAVTVSWLLAPTATLWGCFVMGLRWVTGATLNRLD